MSDKKTNPKIQNLAQFLYESQYPVFFSGAGISTESGLPDFRGPDGGLDPTGQGAASPIDGRLMGFGGAQQRPLRHRRTAKNRQTEIFNISECGQPAFKIWHSTRAAGGTARQHDEIAL